MDQPRPEERLAEMEDSLGELMQISGRLTSEFAKSGGSSATLDMLSGMAIVQQQMLCWMIQIERERLGYEEAEPEECDDA